MQDSTVILCFIVLSTVTAELVLDKASKKCAIESKVSEETLKLYFSGRLVPVDVPETEHFFECRYDVFFDSDNKLTHNECMYDEATAYLESLIKKHKLAAILSRDSMDYCRPKTTGRTRAKAIVALANCFIARLREYDLF